MGIIPFKKPSMDEYVQQARQTEGSVILDVRTPAEYAIGHIEGAINVPVAEIDRFALVIPDSTTPLYLYCASGARSGSAARKLKSLGFVNVTNMGALSGYSGERV